MGKASRDKGARNERELVTMLLNELGEGAACRNLMQTAQGGADIGGDVGEIFAIEVKATKQPRWDWFDQTLRQAEGRIPVLAWRQTGKPWKFFVIQDEAEFLEYVRERMD